MSKTHTKTNSGKSVRERLLNLLRAEHYNPQMMISRYMQERLLYRLSVSNYRERLTLKVVRCSMPMTVSKLVLPWTLTSWQRILTMIMKI